MMSRPMSKPKKINNATKTFIANLIIFQATKTMINPISNKVHKGIDPRNSTLFTTNSTIFTS